MSYTPLFLGLTRQVSFAGLPVSYLVFLICIVMLGFTWTGSFIFLLSASVIGYLCLRALAAYDPKIIDVVATAIRTTGLTPEMIRGEGVIYRA